MFAVPGWSVSASSLKTQSAKTTKTPSAEEASDPASKPSKKRKRGKGETKGADVNPTNLADLWENVIEGKPKEKVDKRQKVAASTDSPAQDVEESVADAEKAAAKKKNKKDKKREKKAKEASGEVTKEAVPPESTTAPPKAVSTLTPLQASMRQKLISARFRHLNQTLYTTPSSESLALFKENPEMFHEYHEGFRRQVEVWPENPVDVYVRTILERGAQRGPVRSGKDATDIQSLPRSEGTCSIADLGCGDAMLSLNLQAQAKALKLKVYSYDLQNPSPRVTKADIANLPLKDGAADVAIFCLALMGTNWIDFIEEAYRILRWKGELWIAEIKSRFGRVKSGKSTRVEHSVGNRKKPDKKELKAAARKAEEDADDAVAMVEVDGHEDTQQETDVSAFVEVLRKRGFVLQGDKAVDLSNKMFVRMQFVKAASPIKGKGVPVPKGMAEMGLETWKKKPKAKFLDEAEVPVSSEAGVLKPCVYKLR